MAASTDGHYRNHCPHCLWSRHVDVAPGDRASDCLGLMEPTGMADKGGGKGWQIVHRCTVCGHRQPNRVVREGRSPDDLDLLLELPWL
ncbi:MAG: RNHCP domain-containing protein [Actinomycetota bacterium]|nr:RNHCP domain-containing protein [Actinomycetota bacterium]